MKNKKFVLITSLVGICLVGILLAWAKINVQYMYSNFRIEKVTIPAKGSLKINGVEIKQRKISYRKHHCYLDLEAKADRDTELRFEHFYLYGGVTTEPNQFDQDSQKLHKGVNRIHLSCYAERLTGNRLAIVKNPSHGKYVEYFFN